MQTNLKEKEETTNFTTGLFIKQIKMQKKRAVIKIADENDFRTQDSSFVVKDDVTDEFFNMWQSAKEIIIELIPQLNRELSALRLNHINFFYDKNGFLKDVEFSVVWTFNTQENILNLNLPKFPIYKPEMEESVIAISGKHEELLHEIIAAAKRYMKGETHIKQVDLGLTIVK